MKIFLNVFLINQDNAQIIKITIGATRYFTDWALELLERTFAMFKLLSDKIKDQEYMLNIQSTLALLFEQASDDLYNRLFERVYLFATSNSITHAIDPIATLCGSLAIVNPQKVLDTFFPYFYNQFVKENHDNDNNNETELHNCSNNEFLWGLAILLKIFSHCGEYLLQYKEKITILLDLFIIKTGNNSESSSPSTKVCKFAFKLLRSTLKALTRTYVREARSSPPSDWHDASSSQGINLLRNWGKPCNYLNLETSWHIPTKDEILWSIDLVNQYGIWAVDKVKDFVNSTNVFLKEKKISFSCFNF